MKTDQNKPTHHHGNLKEALIDYALTAAESGVLDAMSIRKATRALNVSPGAAYRHFQDRDALLRAVAQRGFDRLAARFNAVAPFDQDAQNATDARDRFHALGRAYVAFAKTNYGLWRLMFGPYGRTNQPQTDQPRPSTYDWLGKSMAELAKFDIIDDPSEESQFFAWASIHGLSDLQASPATPSNDQNALIELHCDTLIRAMQSRATNT